MFCLTFEILSFYDESSSEAHFSALEFGFQISSRSVFVVRTRNGLFVYLVRTSKNFAHFAGFQALLLVDLINRSETEDRHLCR